MGRTLRFSHLYLLSQNERSAYQASLDAQRVLFVGKNQRGKSAVLKSLYEAFGALPHKVDERWKNAKVTTLVKFTIDGEPHTLLRNQFSVSLFDARDSLIFRESDTSKLSQKLAKILEFDLVGNDPKTRKVVVPPPSAIFAPFYIDQDRGWSHVWSSFVDLGQGTPKRVLAEYHLGIRTAAYFKALAEKQALRPELRRLEIARKEISKAGKSIETAVGPVKFDYDDIHFIANITGTVEEANRLAEKQENYRRRYYEMTESLRLWRNSGVLARRALREIRSNLQVAATLPSTVFCPTCGAEHSNSLVEQFGLVHSEDDLLSSILDSQERVESISQRMKSLEKTLSEIEFSRKKLEEALSFQLDDNFILEDALRSFGREEARKALHLQMAEIDKNILDVTRSMNEYEDIIMGESQSGHASKVTAKFFTYLEEASHRLDIDPPDRRRADVMLPAFGRGSEGPRAVFAYYIAAIKTLKDYSSTPRCPIVIDSPNQQGQDADHMRTIMRHMLGDAMGNSQVIGAIESRNSFIDKGILVHHISGMEKRLLSEGEYWPVLEAFRPYTGILL